MSDKLFEWSVIVVTIVAAVWLVLGVIFYILDPILMVITAIIFEILVGGALLYFWSKNYLSRS